MGIQLDLPNQPIPDWAATLRTCRGGGAGILDHLPEAAYHGTRAILGKGSLVLAVEKSGVHFKHWLDTPHDEDDSNETFAVGKAFHCRALEPDLFDQNFIYTPEFGNMQTNRAKELRNEWLRSEARNKVALPRFIAGPGNARLPVHPMIEGMAASVRKHPKLSLMLRRGRPEVTALWRDPGTGLPLKSRADWLSDMDGVFLDLKSCFDASRAAMRVSASRNRYFVQDPLYSRAFEENGIHIRNFVFAAVEKVPPYAVGLYQVTDTGRLAGENYYMAALLRVARWIEDDYFPGYNDDRPTPLDVTTYAVEEAEALLTEETALYSEE